MRSPPPPYEFRCLDRQLALPPLRPYWQNLANQSGSHEALYQSPALGDFLRRCSGPQQRFHLYGAYAAGDSAALGLIPLLHTGLGLSGPQRYLCPQQLVLLGSSPLLPASAPLLDAMHSFLLAEFPRVQALVYRALPQSHPIWQHLQQSQRWPVLAQHGWSGCHSMQLPARYTSYLEQLGSKRRYNLKRQQRLLSQACNAPLRLGVIRHPTQLAELEAALALCCPPARRQQLWSQQELEALAELGLLLCFRVDAGRHCCGVLLGLQAGGSYHLFNILPAPAWQALSAGTSILQQALAYLCEQQCWQRLEFGYGQPAYTHQSGHQISLRSRVLVLRDTWRHQLWRQGQLLQSAMRQRWRHPTKNLSD